MSTPPESPQPSQNGSAPPSRSPSPTGIDPRYKRIANWMPLLVQFTGLAGFWFEILQSHPNPTAMAGSISFGLGGKVADVIRKTLL